MALQVTTENPPKGSIPLSRGKAVEYQWNQIFGWPVRSEVWSFSWGLAGLGILSGVSAMYVNLHYRKKLKLRHYGHIATNLPMVIAPMMFSTAMHCQIVTNDLILRETKCPVCLQYRAAAIQLGCGMMYPMILSPVANAMFALRHGTYRVPYWNDYKSTFKMWLEFTRPIGQKLIMIAFIHILAAGFITYSEAKHLYNMQQKLLRLQEQHEMEKLNEFRE